MRRNFCEVLSGAGVDIAAEYHSLHMLVYERYGFYGQMVDNFHAMPFAGTAYNLDDFNNRYDFHFDELDTICDIDDLLLFCEYVYNFAVRLTCSEECLTSSSHDVCDHIEKLADKIGYRFAKDADLWVLIPVNEQIEAAAEVAPEAAGNDLFRYDYRRYKGDLDSKRTILMNLASTLEPRRAKLDKASSAFTSDYFYLVNNLNIRHNNIDPANPGKFSDWVARMPPNKLEDWYDTVRDMSAAAFLLLEYLNKKEEINEAKQR